MSPTLIITGELSQAQQLLQQLLVADLAVDCVVIPEHTDDTPQYQSLIVASAICQRLTIRMGTKADYTTAKWMVLLDQTVHPVAIDERVANLRRVTNRVLENGFQGQLIFAGSDDEVLTYFAWKFSGVAPGQIWGLGTYPLTHLLTHRLAERLAVSATMIQTTVVGRSADPVVAWSRTYVGPTPILMYLANADAKFQADDLDKMGSWLTRLAEEPQTTLRLLGLIHLLVALVADQSVIVPVSHLQPTPPTYAASSPVLVTPEGTKALTTSSLSEDEQQAYTQSLATIQATIQRIEKQQTEEK